VYILVRTSNPGAADFQNRKMEDGRPLYQHVADKVIEWAKNRPGVGAVVGATSLPELGEILKMFAGKDIPVLVPGVGAQGGSAKNVAAIAREVGFELELLRINSSSGLTHPWYKNLGDAIPEVDMCIEMCINELKKLNEEVGYQPAYNFKY
jgi:orotidine-5'-phosphate decarboxylase